MDDRKGMHAVLAAFARMQDQPSGLSTVGGGPLLMTAINFHDPIFDRLRQFLQETPGKLMFRYVPKSPLTGAGELGIREGLMSKLGDDIELQMRETDLIELTACGKLRFLDQRLPVKYGDR
jgi:hypothetical protein